MKGKMTPVLIETVIAYLEKDQEKLWKIPVSVLADVVRWVDKLGRALTIKEVLYESWFGWSKASRGGCYLDIPHNYWLMDNKASWWLPGCFCPIDKA